MATDVRTAGRPLRAGQTRIVRRVIALVDARPVWAVFLLALAVRVIVAAGIAVAHQGGSLAPDGGRYSWMAAQLATGHAAHWADYYSELYHQVAALLAPISWIYAVFGVHEFLGQLYVALLGAGTAAFALGVGLEVLPRRWALAVGIVVAMLPTQIIWSSLVLKDAAVWFALSGLALVIAVAGRSRGVRLLALGILAGAFLMMLGYLRYQTLVVAVWALMLAAPFGRRQQWFARVGGAVALGILIPWLAFSLGPAGLTFAKNSYAPTYYRAKQAQDANNPIAPVPEPSSSTAGAVEAGKAAPDEVPADIKHLPQGVAAMTVQPYPWHGSSSRYLTLARVMEVVWYPVLILALLGLTAIRPRHFRTMAFPLMAGGVILLLYALTEGSLGTAIRHRGEFEWVIALLAGFGLMRLAAWRSGRGPIRLRNRARLAR